MSGGLPTPALRGAAGDTALRRVTIVASRPDDTLVYLQADYASTAEFFDAPEPARLPSSAPPVPLLTALPVRSLPATRGTAYSSSRGVALYSSTQRISSDVPLTHIDVHA